MYVCMLCMHACMNVCMYNKYIFNIMYIYIVIIIGILIIIVIIIILKYIYTRGYLCKKRKKMEAKSRSTKFRENLAVKSKSRSTNMSKKL